MGRTRKIHVYMENEHDWVVDDRPYRANQPFNGYMLHMTVKHTLCLTRKCLGTGEKVHEIDIRIFVNGRFQITHKIEGVIVDRRKKYFDTPMNGYVCLVTDEQDPMNCYGYWRPDESQKGKGKLENGNDNV